MDMMKTAYLAIGLLMLGTGLSLAGDATNDNAMTTDESAKMGKDAGTHTGQQGAKAESDTDKVEQPASQNPTTGNEPRE
jgi:hypothetical protein